MIQYKSNSRQLSLPVFDGQEGESGFHAYIKVPYPFSFRNGFFLLLILLVPCSGRMQSCSKNDEICPDKDVRILSSDWPGLIITSSDWTGLDSPRIDDWVNLCKSCKLLLSGVGKWSKKEMLARSCNAEFMTHILNKRGVFTLKCYAVRILKSFCKSFA